MAHIVRPGKTAGTHRYTDEVQAGQDLIREDEVDGDFDTVYGEFNGGIDDTNIRDGASIDYSKLDLHKRITGDDLVNNILLPPGTTLPPDTHFPGSGGVGNIDTSALALDASSQWAQQNGATVTLPYVVLDTAEHTLSALAFWSPASRNGLVLMHGMFSGFVGSPGPTTYFYARIRKDNPTTGTILAISTIVAQTPSSVDSLPFQLNVISLTNRLGAGYIGPLYLTVQSSNPPGALVGPIAYVQDVQFIGVELA